MAARKRDNQNHFNAIVRMVRSVAAPDREKETLAEELVEMDDQFVTRLSMAQSSGGGSKKQTRERVEEQVERFIKDVEQPKPVNDIRLDREQIREVFSREKSLDEIMDELWAGI
ncbi:MAG: hypothetical protein ABIC95_01420 [archaeon]